MTDHADLIRKLVEAGVEYSASSRYGGLDSPPSVRGYEPHGSTNLSHEEEDLLRSVLGMPVERTEGSCATSFDATNRHGQPATFLCELDMNHDGLHGIPRWDKWGEHTPVEVVSRDGR